MRRSLLKEPAFLLAILVFLLYLANWSWQTTGGDVARGKVWGMVDLIFTFLPFLEPIRTDVIRGVYWLSMLLAIVIFAWLLYLGGEAIWRRIKRIENISPEVKAIRELPLKIDTLIDGFNKLNSNITDLIREIKADRKYQDKK